MRRWLRTTSPPSKRSSRFLPTASTDSSTRPSTRGATCVAWARGFGDSTSSRWPTSGCSRSAARWSASPSGTTPSLELVFSTHGTAPAPTGRAQRSRRGVRPGTHVRRGRAHALRPHDAPRGLAAGRSDRADHDRRRRRAPFRELRRAEAAVGFDAGDPALALRLPARDPHTPAAADRGRPQRPARAGQPGDRDAGDRGLHRSAVARIRRHDDRHALRDRHQAEGVDRRRRAGATGSRRNRHRVPGGAPGAAAARLGAQHRGRRTADRDRGGHAAQVGAAVRRPPPQPDVRRPAPLRRAGRRARGVAARPPVRRLPDRRGSGAAGDGPRERGVLAGRTCGMRSSLRSPRRTRGVSPPSSSSRSRSTTSRPPSRRSWHPLCG